MFPVSLPLMGELASARADPEDNSICIGTGQVPQSSADEPCSDMLRPPRKVANVAQWVFTEVQRHPLAAVVGSFMPARDSEHAVCDLQSCLTMPSSITCTNCSNLLNPLWLVGYVLGAPGHCKLADQCHV